MITKKGGGGHQQPYIPAGHGDESGEYTTFDSTYLDSKISVLCGIVGFEEVVRYAYENHVPPIIETEHLKERLSERNIKRIFIAETLLKPLSKSDIRYDQRGRPSITYYGSNVTLYLNPENGKIISVHKTRKNIRNKFKEKKNVSK